MLRFDHAAEHRAFEHQRRRVGLGNLHQALPRPGGEALNRVALAAGRRARPLDVAGLLLAFLPVLPERPLQLLVLAHPLGLAGASG